MKRFSTIDAVMALNRIIEIDASATEETFGRDLHECARLAKGLVDVATRAKSPHPLERNER